MVVGSNLIAESRNLIVKISTKVVVVAVKAKVIMDANMVVVINSRDLRDRIE